MGYARSIGVPTRMLWNSENLRQEMHDLTKGLIARSLVSGGGAKCKKFGIGESA